MSNCRNAQYCNGEQTVAAEIINEDIETTRDDIAEILKAVLLVPGTYGTMNGEIEDLNAMAKAIELIAKEVNKIAAVHTVETALDNVTSKKSNSKIDMKVDKHTTKLDGQIVTKMSEKVHVNGRVEAIAKAKNFDESSMMGKFNSFQKCFETVAEVSRNVPRARKLEAPRIRNVKSI
ncbi:hypothetical protein K4K57_009706 [Colletotrichum sp. SAR 10_99]|nr:hypothetical protein K4K55_010657 [Colletotrichum sp. SAR 10_96]KAI8289091.1 hypothetical protein K4K56_007763 [Colletotrichum sp. SAR 10_98]KAJ5008884.1 hypothetical protein K4K57_009706 [Colletotrichum sp. SAR 10_99]